MADCVFCGIVSGAIPAELVLERDDFVGFLDARPVFKGHVLLVPREHVETLPDLPAALRDGFLAAAQRPRGRGQGRRWVRRGPSSP